jgi:acetoacetate decarboxylase
MSLRGFTLPLTATGRSSVVAPPPWHYSGEIIAVDFTVSVQAAAALLPAGLVPMPEGSASVVFADWCSSSDHDERVLADPAIGQYHEAYVVLHAIRGDKKVGRVPFIWVDSELSLLRGQIQGFPKKLLGRGGVRKEPGAIFAAHATSHGRRLLTVGVQIASTSDRLPRAATLPLVHTRVFPSIDRAAPAVHELQIGTIDGFACGPIHVGPAKLEIGKTEYEELEGLTPKSVGSGYVFSMAFSVLGGTVEPI